MPNKFDFVINYMREDISKKYDSLGELSVEITNLDEFINHLIKRDSSYVYSLDLFKKLYSNDYEKNYEKFNESLYILDRVLYDKLRHEPQIINMLNLIGYIEENINILINQKISLYQKLKKEYLDKKNLYSKYMNILNGNLDSINDSVLINDFFDFLRNSTLDKDKVDELINYLSQNRIIHIEEFDEESKEDNKDAIKEEKQESDEEQKIIIPTLDKELIGKIENYKEIFESLSDKEKNMIISVNELIKSGYTDNLENAAYGFNNDEILYYREIYMLIDLYQKYNELLKEKYLEEASMDKDLFEVLSSSLQDIINDINKSLDKINNYEEKLIEKEEQIEENDQHNILLFLEDSFSDKEGNFVVDSIVNIDMEYIKETYGGVGEQNIKQVVRMLNTRFKLMSSEEFRNLGVHANKPLFNYSNYSEFDKFNVRSSKGSVNNPARITYIKMPISENNRKELCARYNLPSDANIYLILGLFLKKNDDSEYVRITHNRLLRHHDEILELQRMFSSDFDDITRLKIQKLIDDGYNKMDELNKLENEVNVR